MPGNALRDDAALDADLRWCHDAVQGVSRTFALTIEILDEPMSSYICLGYLLCRIPDTIEDANHIPPTDQAALLRLYDSAIDPEDDTTIEEFSAQTAEFIPDGEAYTDDWMVVEHADRVVHTFERQPHDVREAVLPPARELVQGMATFVERYAHTGGLRIQSREELEEYCYYAAGTVGYLVTNLVVRGNVTGERARKLYDTAESFGMLLQLVNIAKDVYADYNEENNVYLPAEWLEDESVSQEELMSPGNTEGASSVVRRTADHASTFMDEAHTYLENVPETDGNRFAAWGIPFLLAVGTLRELTRRPEDALSAKGVKIGRDEVASVVASLSTNVGRERLTELKEVIASRPYTLMSANPDSS